jgi:hypothetical protein
MAVNYALGFSLCVRLDTRSLSIDAISHDLKLEPRSVQSQAKSGLPNRRIPSVVNLTLRARKILSLFNE